MKIARKSCFLRALIPILVFIISPAIPESSLRAAGYSARIHSLGGKHVAGIIPDYWTDLNINPAYADMAGATVVRYGYRNVKYSLEMPWLSYYYAHGPYMSESAGGRINNISFYGAGLGDWKFAFDAEWYFDDEEELNSGGSASNSPGKIYSETYEEYNMGNTEIWSFSVTGARSVGHERKIGISFGSKGFYRTVKDRELNSRTRYIIHYEPIDYALDYSRKWDRLSNGTVRKRCYFLKLGLLKQKRGRRSYGITAAVERTEEFARHNGYDLYIYKSYDDEEELGSYDYELKESRDLRNGPLWRGKVTAQLRLPHSLNLFSGVMYQELSYQADWYDISHNIYIRSYNNSNNRTFKQEDISGKGRYRGFRVFAALGRKTEIYRKLDLHTSIHSSFSTTTSRENNPLLCRISVAGEHQEINLDGSSEFKYETDNYRANLTLPFSLEFKPTSYLTIFSHLSIRTTWTRAEEKTIYPDPETTLTPEGTDYHTDIPNLIDNVESFTASYYAGLGLSLHRNDRLYMDIYLGNDPTPDSLTLLTIDARYRF